jgi:hypothetical protein
MEEGAFARARELLEATRTGLRHELSLRASELFELLVLLESAMAEGDSSPGVKNREALAACEEALALLSLAKTDPTTSIAALARAATRAGVEGLSRQSANYLRAAIRLGEQAGLNVEVESLRENLLYGYLVSTDVEAALAEVESWKSWPFDEVGMWLLIEVFFQSRRLECVPLLERMLRSRSERDTLSVVKMEQMIETARNWSRDTG